MYGNLALLFQLMLCSPEGAATLATDTWLRALFGALHVASLRCARLVLRVMAHVLPRRSPDEVPVALFEPLPPAAAEPPPPPLPSYGATPPAESFAEALGLSEGGGSPLAQFLLMLVGGQSAGRMALPFTLFAGSVLWRNAQVQTALASEVTTLLRQLMLCDNWAEMLHAAFRAAICEVPNVVGCLVEDPTAARLAQGKMLHKAMRALGALNVLGGRLPSLFVGCRVSIPYLI
jgi:hypothetical protein